MASDLKTCAETPSGRRPSREQLPSLDDIDIPADIQPDSSWTRQMLELADHIGGHAVLKIVAAFGGDYVYISGDPSRSPFTDILDTETTAIIARAYGGNRLAVPTGKAALARAKRAGLIAAVRAGMMSAGDAARILRTSRSYMSHLVNATDEAAGATPVRIGCRAADPRQIDMFNQPADK